MKRVRGAFMGAVMLALGWQFLHLALKTPALPSPAASIFALRDSASGEVLAHVLASLWRISAALVLQLVVGGSLGLLLGSSKAADAALGPPTRALFPVPKMALLPLFLVAFGLGDAAKIAFVATVLVFQTALSVRDGVRDIPASATLAARSLGLRGLAFARHVTLPAVLPRIFSSLRSGVGMGTAALFFAENFATRRGLGYFVMNSYAMADYPATYGGIVALSLLGLALFAVVDLAERLLCPWIGRR